MRTKEGKTALSGPHRFLLSGAQQCPEEARSGARAAQQLCGVLLVAFPCGVSVLGELPWAKLRGWIRVRRAGSCGADGLGVLGEAAALARS